MLLGLSIIVDPLADYHDVLETVNAIKAAFIYFAGFCFPHSSFAFTSVGTGEHCSRHIELK